tara:strand:- start:665 stop:949 length:285 start_codon:yes stop_codon:yes gene_type:complete
VNYTLKQLRDRVDQLIQNQGEDAHCGAWIYTAEDCMIRDKDDDEPVFLPEEVNSELSERIFNDVGNIDYIYTVIQECVDEVTEEQYMLMQQEMV